MCAVPTVGEVGSAVLANYLFVPFAGPFGPHSAKKKRYIKEGAFLVFLNLTKTPSSHYIDKTKGNIP